MGNESGSTVIHMQDMIDSRLHADSARPPESREDGSAEPESTVERPQNSVLAWIEAFAHKWGATHLRTLVKKKGRVHQTMRAVPDNMHRVANQTQLILELVDDFRDGTYRGVSWRSIALLTGALLYSVSPADVIPDALPLVGQLDDLVLIAIVTRMVQNDLRDYCRFKGYAEHEYFRN